MATTFNKSDFFPKDVVFDTTGSAPAPSKDFGQILVTLSEVIFRWWKIIPPTRSDFTAFPPQELKDTYEEFLEDDRMQSEIERVFGIPLLEYIKELVHGRADYLTRLPDAVLIRMLLCLNLEDINCLAQVNKQFRELCVGNNLWERIYRCYSETPVTWELEQLARDEGWRKLFFTNKLQLQMQLRRQASKVTNGDAPH